MTHKPQATRPVCNTEILIASAINKNWQTLGQQIDLLTAEYTALRSSLLGRFAAAVRLPTSYGRHHQERPQQLEVSCLDALGRIEGGNRISLCHRLQNALPDSPLYLYVLNVSAGTIESLLQSDPSYGPNGGGVDLAIAYNKTTELSRSPERDLLLQRLEHIATQVLYFQLDVRGIENMYHHLPNGALAAVTIHIWQQKAFAMKGPDAQRVLAVIDVYNAALDNGSKNADHFLTGYVHNIISALPPSEQQQLIRTSLARLNPDTCLYNTLTAHAQQLNQAQALTPS
ncbi:MAG: hypothetical protein V4621_03865 [Pseudomonadota bacterium]